MSFTAGPPGLESSLVDILIVDDDAAFCTAAERYLQARGHRTRCAVDGIDAVEQMTERDPDLVICDLRMPRLDGLGFLQRLREEHSDVPFVMVTGHPSADTADQARRIGADDYLEKPFEMEDLLASISRTRRELD